MKPDRQYPQQSHFIAILVIITTSTSPIATPSKSFQLLHSSLPFPHVQKRKHAPYHPCHPRRVVIDPAGEVAIAGLPTLALGPG
jgi:hypothetical protein